MFSCNKSSVHGQAGKTGAQVLPSAMHFAVAAEIGSTHFSAEARQSCLKPLGILEELVP